MITIYTLAYAAIIPISGKLADRYGRKVVYLTSIGLFGLGSLICALSASTGLFSVLLVGRVVQAIGGGGIIPVATAEFGTTFPENRRGLALGLVGGVYGIANIIGSSAGSAILDIFGKSQWNYLFLVNVPISIAILGFGFFFLPNNKGERSAPIDWLGIPVLALMILSLLYGLRSIDFFHFGTSILSTDVYPYLIAFAVLLPILLLIERRAKDPVLSLGLFTNRETLVPLVLSFLVGVMMMGMVFVPQMAENSLQIASGSGGYFVAVLGLFAGLSGPLSGTLIDRFGAKRILGIGFAVTFAGSLFLILYMLASPSLVAVFAALAIVGLGLGFTMGTPLNYMMLSGTPKEKSNSALATLSLVRSIGTAIAPAIMVGFLVNAGLSAQTSLMELMPPVQAPKLVNYEILKAQYDEMKKDPVLAERMKDSTLPDVAAGMTTNPMTGSDGNALPADLKTKLQSADVTNIVDVMKELASRMYDEKTPAVIDSIQGGLGMGIAGIDGAIDEMTKDADGMTAGAAGMDAGLKEMQGALAGFDAALSSPMVPAAQRDTLVAQRAGVQAAYDALLVKQQELVAGRDAILKAVKQEQSVQKTMQALSDEIPGAFATARTDYLISIEAKRGQLETVFQESLDNGFRDMYLLVAASTILAFLVLLFYRTKRKTPVVQEG
jgi:MFS family permease